MAGDTDPSAVKSPGKQHTYTYISMHMYIRTYICTYVRTYVHRVARLNIHSLSLAHTIYRDSRRSSLGSCRQGGLCSLNPCSNIINFKDTTERGRGDKSRERGSSNSGRRDSNSILDQFFQGIRTTKGCAKAARTPLCTPSTTPGSTAYSISDIKHILTPLYLTHSKDLDDDNDSKRGYMGGGVEQEFSHDINIVTEQLRITKKRDRIFSILTAKTLSRYNSCSYDDMAESSNVFEKASQ